MSVFFLTQYGTRVSEKKHFIFTQHFLHVFCWEQEAQPKVSIFSQIFSNFLNFLSQNHRRNRPGDRDEIPAHGQGFRYFAFCSKIKIEVLFLMKLRYAPLIESPARIQLLQRKLFEPRFVTFDSTVWALPPFVFTRVSKYFTSLVQPASVTLYCCIVFVTRLRHGLGAHDKCFLAVLRNWKSRRKCQ